MPSSTTNTTSSLTSTSSASSSTRPSARNTPTQSSTQLSKSSTSNGSVVPISVTSKSSGNGNGNGNGGGGGGGGSALLLRLFESSFFNVHLAVSYLKTYPDSIGITYYLVTRLASFPEEEVEFYWPQLCHLLVTRPSESVALESFIMRRCEESTHIAMLSLWNFQAALSDLSSQPHTPQFAICRRVFNRVQGIIFANPLDDLEDLKEGIYERERRERHPRAGLTTSTSSSVIVTRGRNLDSTSASIPTRTTTTAANPTTTTSASTSIFSKLSPKNKISPTSSSLATILGMSTVMSSVAVPELSRVGGRMAVEQGRSRGGVDFLRGAGAGGKTAGRGSGSDDDLDGEGEDGGRREKRRSTTNRDRNGHVASGSISMSSISSEMDGDGDGDDDGDRYSSSVSFVPGEPIRGYSTKDQMSFLPPRSRGGGSLRGPKGGVGVGASGGVGASPPSVGKKWSSAQSLSTSSSSSPYSKSRPGGGVLGSGRGTGTGGGIEEEGPTPKALRTSEGGDEEDDHDDDDGPTEPNSPNLPDTNLLMATPTGRRPTLPSSVSATALMQQHPHSFSVPSLHLPFSSSRIGFPSTASPSSVFFNGHGQRGGGGGGVGGNNPFGPYNPFISGPPSFSSIASNLPESLLTSLLRAHSCRSQLDLLTSLQDISTRLVLVPKPARLSALRAELTVLNHGLPRGCCLSFGCCGSYGSGIPSVDESCPFSSPSPSLTKHSRPHHRVVRISPSEAVVLNSADRAPFLLHVEVLEGDLDFDPKRRQNDEDLRRVLGEWEMSVARRSQGGFGGFKGGNGNGNSGEVGGKVKSVGFGNVPVTATVKKTPVRFSHDNTIVSTTSAAAKGMTTGPSAVTMGTKQVSTPTRSARYGSSGGDGDLGSPSIDRAKPGFASHAAEDEEEMDLVDQLYGNFSIRDAPVPEPMSFAPTIHNRSVDEEAWKRSHASGNGNGTNANANANANGRGVPSSSSSSSGGPGERNGGHSSAASKIDASPSGTTRGFAGDMGDAKANGSPATTTTTRMTTKTALNVAKASREPITLDQYAERMRMAAIMLAQLTASQQAQSSSTASSAGGALVGVGMGIGAGIGGAVGAGFEAVRGRLPFAGLGRRDSSASQASTSTSSAMATAAVAASMPSEAAFASASAGQGAAGTTTRLDTTSAAAGLSDVSGAPHPNLAAEISGAAPASNPASPASTPQQPRQRVLAPAEATAIREKIMSEMMALEEERMLRMREDGRARSGWPPPGQTAGGGGGGMEDERVVLRAVNKDDPSGAVLRESWTEKKARIRAASPYGHLAKWDVLSCIVKTGADLRQEQLATQLIKEFGKIWTEENCPHWVRYFRIMATGESSGLLETIKDSVSIHSIKKDAYARAAAQNTGFISFTLFDHFVETFGDPSTVSFRKAQDAFMKSLASYSIISYLLQLKDRHNGNILVDREGHLIHIDFGFLLSNSPGSLGFEMAPFKLPQDYVDILGGMDTEKFSEFKVLLKKQFREVRKHADRIIMIVELMQKESKLPCFQYGDQTAQKLRERFQLSLTQAQADEFVESLVAGSALSVSTRLYDFFQYYSQSIL